MYGGLNKRISNINKRPLLKTGFIDVQLNSIFRNRKSLYEDISDFTLNTDLLTSDETTQIIINHLRIRDEKNSG